MDLTALLDRITDDPPTLLPGPGRAVELTGVVHDTRQVQRGSLFCCVRGARVDGHDLADAAIEAGAAALLVERALPVEVPQLVVPSVRAAMGPVAAAFWGHPSANLHVVGVTGTSGKTTTTHLLRAILEHHGWSTALLGTLSGPRTTPEAPELQATLAAELAAGRRAVVMEVSSHALALGRVRATRFACAVFTNLSQDHLDFHRDMDDYFAAKARLFTPEQAEQAVVNLDDRRGRWLLEQSAVPTTGFSMADAEALEVGPTRSRFRWRGQLVELPLGGAFNVANALAAATAAAQLGVEAPTIAAGLASAPAVPGRFEPVEEGQPFTVVVDYAHKPGALAQVLEAARDVAGAGRVIVVFGAGGDRDQSKRAAMGQVAARLADRVLLTSDNPRGEDPLAIIDAIRSGMPHQEGTTIEPDRATAIALAIHDAQPGDVVVVAGKGHEATQVVGEQVLDFDDREISRRALRRRQEVAPW